MSLETINLASKTELISTGFAKTNAAISALNTPRTIVMTGVINANISTVLSNSNTIVIPTSFADNVWTSTNDGAGSGLDADLIRGQSPTYWTDWSRLGNKPISSVGYGITDVVRNNANSTIIAPYSLSFAATTRQMINLWATNFGIGVQDNTLYFRTGQNLSIHLNGVHSNTANDPGAGGAELFRLNSYGIYLDPKGTLGTAWYRSTGQTGWYNETYQGGWHMTDGLWLRNYNQKGLFITKNWDNYGNVLLYGNAPSLVFYDNDAAKKWMIHCNNDGFYVYRTNTSSIDAADYVSKFVVDSAGNITCAGSVSCTALTTTSEINAYSISRFGWNSNVVAGDGSSSLEVRSVTGGIPGIAFHSPNRIATKIMLDAAGKLTIGGWSWSTDRMTLDGSGNATFAGVVTASNFLLTGGTPMAGVKSIRHVAAGYSASERALIVGAYDYNKTSISVTNAGMSTGIAYVRLDPNNNAQVLFLNQLAIQIYFDLIEYY